MELSKEAFINELTELAQNGARFNVESEDSGSMYFSLGGCCVAFSDDGIDGEVVFFKPNTDMEVTFDFNIIGCITKTSEKTYGIEFNANIADVTIMKIA